MIDNQPGVIEVVVKTTLWLASIFIVSTLIGVIIGLPLALIGKALLQ